MAGILNSKERTLDTLVTSLGREQAAQGVLNVYYASFTDYHTFYQASGSENIVEDHTNRIYFEAHSRTQDLIVPEAAMGRTTKSFVADNFRIENEMIAEGTFKLGQTHFPDLVTGSYSEFNLLTDRVLKSITKNFKDLKLIGTTDTFSSTTGFEFLYHTGTFNYFNSTFPDERQTTFNDGARTVDFDSIPNLFSDEKLSSLPNFKYLPPRNMPSNENRSGEPMGYYPEIGPQGLTLDMLLDNLAATKRQKQEFVFKETSLNNNLLCQVFEVKTEAGETPNIFKKLDIIDFGSHTHVDDEGTISEKRVYFIGKLVDRDDILELNRPDLIQSGGSFSGTNTKSQSFVNIFTLVFE